MADSIYALGTPVGRSAVAVIRVSGSGFSKGFIKFLNIPVEKKGSWLRSLDLGSFSDQCLVLNFPGSNSYTGEHVIDCLLYTSPSPRDKRQSRMPSSA